MFGSIAFSLTKTPASFKQKNGDAKWVYNAEESKWTCVILKTLFFGMVPKGSTFHYRKKGAGLVESTDPLTENARGKFKHDETVITISERSYHHSQFGDIEIVVTDPTSFTQTNGDARFEFDSGKMTWKATILKPILMGAVQPGAEYIFQKLEAGAWASNIFSDDEIPEEGDPTTAKEKIDPLEKISELKKLLDMGALTQAEFDDTKKKLLERV